MSAIALASAVIETPQSERATSREELFRQLMVMAVQMDDILRDDILPILREAGHPLTGRVISLRSEIKLRAMLIGGSK